MLVIQIFFGMGEAGAFPIATRSLSRWMRPDRTRLRAGRHARRFTFRRRPDAAHRRSHHCEVRLARRVPGLRIARHHVGRRLVFLLSRHAGGASRRQSGRARVDRLRAASAPPKSPGARFSRTAICGFLSVMYFCYNFNLNVYQDWFPTYLHDSRGMTLAKMGFYARLPLFAGTLGDCRRLVLGWRAEAHRQRESGAALGRDRRLPSLGRGHDSRRASRTIPRFPSLSTRWRSSDWNGPSASPGRCRSISAAISPAPFPPS